VQINPRTTAKDRSTTWQQHNMVAEHHDNNMAAAQHMVQALLGTDNSTKGKKVETTIHQAKQPQLSVRVSMIEYLNEEIEIKTVQFECLLQLVPVTSCSKLKRVETQGCVCFGDLEQNVTCRTGVVCGG
jgi:hypothetical protein